MTTVSTSESPPPPYSFGIVHAVAYDELFSLTRLSEKILYIPGGMLAVGVHHDQVFGLLPVKDMTDGFFE